MNLQQKRRSNELNQLLVGVVDRKTTVILGQYIQVQFPMRGLSLAHLLQQKHSQEGMFGRKEINLFLQHLLANGMQTCHLESDQLRSRDKDDPLPLLRKLDGTWMGRRDTAPR